MRGLVEEAVIPFMVNQRRSEAVLRMDARARVRGEEDEVPYASRGGGGVRVCARNQSD